MKYLAAFLVALVLLLITGCNKGSMERVSSYVDPDIGKLTNAKAQRAIQQWMGKGSVAVQGIQEVPQENAAKADISFNNFRWNAKGNMFESAGETQLLRSGGCYFFTLQRRSVGSYKSNYAARSQQYLVGQP